MTKSKPSVSRAGVPFNGGTTSAAARRAGDGVSVGFIAERAGVAVSALHFYEQEGLIRSWRNSANHRRYDRDVLRRVAVIRVAQKAGVPLKEIAKALATLPQGRTPNTDDRLAAGGHGPVLLDDPDESF